MRPKIKSASKEAYYKTAKKSTQLLYIGKCGSTDLKVHVAPGGLASGTHIADYLPLSYIPSYRNGNFAHVRVKRLGSVRMRDNQIQAVAAIPALQTRDYNRSSGRGQNRRAAVCREILGVPSVQTLRYSSSVYRPDIVSGITRAARAPRRRA